MKKFSVINPTEFRNDAPCLCTDCEIDLSKGQGFRWDYIPEVAALSGAIDEYYCPSCHVAKLEIHKNWPLEDIADLRQFFFSQNKIMAWVEVHKIIYKSGLLATPLVKAIKARLVTFPDDWIGAYNAASEILREIKRSED